MSTLCVDSTRLWSAARPTSSGTATSSASPTTSWPSTSTTSKSPPRELHHKCAVFTQSKSSSAPTARVTATASQTSLLCVLAFSSDSGFEMWFNNNHILAQQNAASFSRSTGLVFLTADRMDQVDTVFVTCWTNRDFIQFCDALTQLKLMFVCTTIW